MVFPVKPIPRKDVSPKQPAMCQERCSIPLTRVVGRLFGGEGQMGLSREKYSSGCTSQVIYHWTQGS